MISGSVSKWWTWPQYTRQFQYIYVYIYMCIYISADPSHLQGERARGKVALIYI